MKEQKAVVKLCPMHCCFPAPKIAAGTMVIRKECVEWMNGWFLKEWYLYILKFFKKVNKPDGGWVKWYSTCLESSKTWAQTPVPYIYVYIYTSTIYIHIYIYIYIYIYIWKEDKPSGLNITGHRQWLCGQCTAECLQVFMSNMTALPLAKDSVYTPTLYFNLFVHYFIILQFHLPKMTITLGLPSKSPAFMPVCNS
jgi:hypothetical protein